MSPTHNSAAFLQRLSRARAEQQASRIPWQRLQVVRTQYIELQTFQMWVRSIFETEGRLPDWLAAVVEERCPGFLEADREDAPTPPRPFPLRLEEWIDEHIFGFAKRGGWFDAIAYYAIRDARYQRVEVCWAESVEKWRKAKPIRYPSLEEWQVLAENCDDTAHLAASVRKAKASSKYVDRERLSEAVIRYMDWEAFAFWARPALERSVQLPEEVGCELRRRCPDFLHAVIQPEDGARGDLSERWQKLIIWVTEHCFADAWGEGWFDAILLEVRSHPRAIRTQEYADHFDEIWNPDLAAPYPCFEDWRREADSYVAPEAD